MNLNIPSKTDTSIFNNQPTSLLTVIKTEEKEKTKKRSKKKESDEDEEKVKPSRVGLI